jgi:RND family efflux transporter MFP subunit
LLLTAANTGCKDPGELQHSADVVRPVKTFVVPIPNKGADIELPGQVRAPEQVDLAFEEVKGKIIELPVAGQEGQRITKGELLAQIDPAGFRVALGDAEERLYEAYSVLELARAENERMGEMKRINPDLVSASMLGRTRQKLEQAEVRHKSAQLEVDKAEELLEYSSLRAPFTGIIVRTLVAEGQQVQAGEPIVSLQDITHLEVLAEVSERLISPERKPGQQGISATARIASVPGKEFPLTFKEATATGDPSAGTYRILFEMPKPKDIDPRPGTTATVNLSGEGQGMSAGPVSIPAVALMTDPDGQHYVWLIVPEELRTYRRDVRIGRLAGSDQIQILRGLTGGERIVVAGVMQLSEGRQVRLWEAQEAGQAE